MAPSHAASIARAFVDAINRHDVEAIANLMTEDHVFIDSLGMRVTGKQQMKKGWEGYFSMVPDYGITVEETFSEGDVAIMLGLAQGTCSKGGALQPENRWQTPAAWRVVIRESSIAEWRVYADNEPIRQILSRNRSSE
jgi:uncharacterized protein (TIGR02246 family)